MTGVNSTNSVRNGEFSLGVVEGFYGMPWSAEQRKILFGWMEKMGLNTYMYAPKDDSKHRAHWRDLYSVEEAEILTSLIESAHEKNVTFVYAISPGLDISFSNTKDVTALKRKLEQVGTFGCKAFALLFDDIDPELSEADRSVFSSFSLAQVSVANEVYEYLNQPKFFFCPTEYCSSRAVPNVQSSVYLNTIGSKLLPGIDIMWTGCKVISKKITIQTLEDISTVLKRPPVIWDNIHANDYDPRRVFLGPYDGRSPDIIPYIRGVLTNPNCEFEANYVACHTLGQWCKSNPGGVKKDIISSERMSPVAADIKLETESDFGSDDDLPSNLDLRYSPRRALKVAMSEWLEEFSILRHPPRRHVPPPVTFPPPGVPTDAPLTGLPPGVPPLSPTSCPVAPPELAEASSNHAPMESPSEPASKSDHESPVPPESSPLPLPLPPLGVPPVPEGIPPVSVSMPVPDMVKTCTITTPTLLTPAATTVSDITHMEVPSQTIPLSSISEGSIPTPVEAPPTCPENLDSIPNPNPSLLQPLSEPVSALAEDCLSTDLDGLSEGDTGVEAMDCVPSSGLVSQSSGTDATKMDSSESVDQMEVCGNDKPEPGNNGMADASVGSNSSLNHTPSELTKDDLALLVDLFYLPFEHGSRALQLLNTFHWLTTNMHCVRPDKKDTEECREWLRRVTEFEQIASHSDTLLRRVFYSPNKSLLCCLHAYLWDLKCTLSVCVAYVRWLFTAVNMENKGPLKTSKTGHGIIPDVSALPSTKMANWFSEGYKEAFMSGDMEPWAFRGGLQTELQRMLPIAAAHDLFFIKPPDIIVPETASFRPYLPQDEDQIYDICLKTCDDGMDGTDVFPENPRLIGDRLVGKFLALSPKFCFVVEDMHGVYGYVLAARDAHEFNGQIKASWTPAMCQKYPKPVKDDISPAEEVMLSFHTDPVEVSEEILRCYPSVLRLDILPKRMCDPAVPRRLLACALAALKAAGSYGVHTELNAGDEFMADFYAKLGFFTVGGDSEKCSDDMMYMGRLF